MEGGKEANYWPGFVDALSNVVLTLVFVLVVFVFALVIASSKVDKKVQEIVEQKVEQAKNTAEAQKAETEKIGLQKQLDDALAEVKKLKSSKGAQSQSDANTTQGQESVAKFKKSDASQEAKVDAKSQEMIITFNQNAISLTDDTVKNIGTFLEKYKDKDGKISGKVTLESSVDVNAPGSTQAKEAELGRNLNVRNTLLNNKADPANISIKNVDPSQQEGTYNWVKIHVDK